MAELTDDQWDDFVEAIGDNTEATQMLAENLRSASKTAGDSLNSLSDNADNLADDFDSMNNEVRDATDELEQFTKTSNALENAWKDVTEVSSNLITAFGNSTKEILANGESFGVMRQFINPMADAAGMVVKGLGEVAAAGVGLVASVPLVGGGAAVAAESLRGLSKIAAEVITKLIKFGSNLVIDGIEQLWSMFEGAASAGVLFSNGLQEMNEQRGNLSLTTQEYTEVVKGSRDQLTVFGGSVGEGAKRLADVGKESKVFNEELRAMGITYKEQAENTADFMSSLQRSGQLRLMNDKQIAAASAEYQKNLAVMSSLTGKSIDTLKQEREEALKNMAFQAKLAKMDPAVRKEMEEALTSMPAGMKQAFQESVIFGKVMTDTGAIVSGAAGYIEKFATSVANGSASNEDAFQAFRDDLKANAPRLRENLGDLAAAGMAELLGNGNAVTGSINTFADSLYKEISRAENTSTDTVKRMLSTGEQQEESVKQILAGLDAQRQMQDKMLKLIETEGLPIASKMFQKIAEVMNEQLGNFVSWVKDPKSFADSIPGADTVKSMMEGATAIIDGAMDLGRRAFQAILDLIENITSSTWYQRLFGEGYNENEHKAEIQKKNIAQGAERVSTITQMEDTTGLRAMNEMNFARQELEAIQLEKTVGNSRGGTRLDYNDEYTGPTRDQQAEELNKLIKLLEKKMEADKDASIEMSADAKAALAESRRMVYQQEKLVREFRNTQ